MNEIRSDPLRVLARKHPRLKALRAAIARCLADGRTALAVELQKRYDAIVKDKSK